MGNIQDEVGRCDEGPRRFTMQKEGRGLVPTSALVVAGRRRHYLQPFSTADTVLEVEMFKDNADGKLEFCFGREEGNEDVLL